MNSTIEIADIDCIYLTYDEPLADEFWAKIQIMVPWAKRVHGVKGSDAAHKAAAAASDTDRFVLIDGDNLPDANFFNMVLHLPDHQYQQAVFRWRARNHINGLMYGNGGISCWTRDFVNNMRTHEATDGRTETQVEFCFDPLYWAMHDCYSTTYPNGSAFHAWRAGFREGVKMCLDRGRKPTLAEFQERAHRRNLDNLNIWHNLGSDVEHGWWAMAGARQGTYMTMLTNWDHRLVQDFAALEVLWLTVADNDPRVLAGRLAEPLHLQLDLPMLVLESEQSQFFKTHFNNSWQNRGIMVREIDALSQRAQW